MGWEMLANLEPEQGTRQGEGVTQSCRNGDSQDRRDEDNWRPRGLGGRAHSPGNSCVHSPAPSSKIGKA